MGSGVAINLVLAFVLFVFVFSGYGVHKATTTVDTVSQVRDRRDRGQPRPADPHVHAR